MSWTETELSKEAQQAAMKGARYCMPVHMAGDRQMQEYAQLWAVAGLRAAAPIIRREAIAAAEVEVDGATA